MREEPLQNLTANSLGVQYQAFLAVSESITAHRDLAALFRDLVLRLQAVVQFDFVTLILHDPPVQNAQAWDYAPALTPTCRRLPIFRHRPVVTSCPIRENPPAGPHATLRVSASYSLFW